MPQAGRRSAAISAFSAVKCSYSRRHQLRLQHRRHLIPSEIQPLGRLHLRHRHIRLAVVVVRIPEQEPNPALVLRRQNLHFNIFRRIRLRPPRKRLQPRTNHHPAPRRDLLKPVHRLANKMLRLRPPAWRSRPSRKSVTDKSSATAHRNTSPCAQCPAPYAPGQAPAAKPSLQTHPAKAARPSDAAIV